MRLLAAVLVLWVATQILHQQGGAMPPMLVWAWWTVSLMLVSASAWADTYLTLPNRVAGLLSYTLTALYYITQQGVYMGFVPTDADHPDLWPTIYMVANLAAPIGLTTLGIARHAVQKE